MSTLKFKTPVIAEESASKIYQMYEVYNKEEKDFVGMDMCRKFLEMGTLLRNPDVMQTTEMQKI